MSQWSGMGRWLVAIGLFVTALGLLLWFGDRVPFVGRLPGDFHIKGKHVHVVFPLATCLILSVLLTLILNLLSRK